MIMKNALHLLAGFILGSLMFWGLIAYATWRDNSMVPIEDTRDDCEVWQEHPVRIVVCGSPDYRKFPGHTTL